ncbi:MAG: hypothetical protein ABIL58_24205 [Pseudomonadota bacterium]
MLAAVFFLAAISAHVEAYVVPGPQAAALMTRALGSGSALSVQLRIRFHDLALETTAREVIETAVYLFPERYRSEIRSAGIHRIHVEAGGKAVTITDDRVTSRSVSTVDQYKDLLLFRKPALLIEKLAGYGVNPQVTSLGRFGDALVVIIGARYPDESRPQVWLDKESFLPLRWIVRPDADSSGPFEIHFSAWQEVQGQWFPRRIESYENNVLTREILVEKVLPSASARPGDFDVEALAARYVQPPGTTGSAPPTSEIDKTIEDFRKRFESN